MNYESDVPGENKYTRNELWEYSSSDFWPIHLHFFSKTDEKIATTKFQEKKLTEMRRLDRLKVYDSFNPLFVLHFATDYLLFYIFFGI